MIQNETHFFMAFVEFLNIPLSANVKNVLIIMTLQLLIFNIRCLICSTCSPDRQNLNTLCNCL